MIKLLEEKYHVKETEEDKFAMELDGYIKKLIWRKWDTPIWKSE